MPYRFHDSPGVFKGIIMAQATRTASHAHPAEDPRAERGEWELLPYHSQIEAVHMALLRTGKVLYYSGFREQENVRTATRLWDPKTHSLRAPHTPSDLFCAGHGFLPDGRLLSTGGTSTILVPAALKPWVLRAFAWLGNFVVAFVTNFLPFVETAARATGDTSLYLFDPATEEWKLAGEMLEGRWYPTNTALPDGRLLLLSGFTQRFPTPLKDQVTEGIPPVQRLNPYVEVFDPERGVEKVADLPPMMAMPGERYGHSGFPTVYPRMHVLPLPESQREKYPRGRAFCSGYGPETKMLNLATWEWEHIDNLRFEHQRHDGCAVLLPLRPPDYRARVITFGGSPEGGGQGLVTETTEIIDLDEQYPTWRYTNPMREKRVHAVGVTLPDGNILVVGGTRRARFVDAVHLAEVFDPETETWRDLAEMKIPRGYHATAILLPDGRVLCSGTTPYGKQELRLEVYSPYYLFRGPRPEVSDVPERVTWGETVQVHAACPQDRPARVALMRPGAMTHAFDMESRYVELEFEQTGEDELAVTLPPDAHVAPPGYYMLFVLNSRGVPSVGRFLRLDIAEVRLL